MSVNTSVPSIGGVMVSIDAFQALDPGSIPGHRTLFFLRFKLITLSGLLLNGHLFSSAKFR